MRMWNVDPQILCRKHLLGEHVEMHMFVGSIRKNQSVTGFIAGGLVNTSLIQTRHEELATEMLRRGYNHKSPLEYDDHLNAGQVSIEKNLVELARRCIECRTLQTGASK